MPVLFINSNKPCTLDINGSQVNRAYINGRLVFQGVCSILPPEPVDGLRFNIASGETVSFIIPNRNSHSIRYVSYSTDSGVTWVTFNNPRNMTITATASTYGVIWRGDSDGYGMENYDYTCRFTASASHSIEGNMMSMLWSNSSSTSTLYNNVFRGMFMNDTGLTSADGLILPATTLTEACYLAMFRGCTNMLYAPELNSTSLASFCYSDMFWGSGILECPDLPATDFTNTRNVYSSMFRECQNITRSPLLAADSLTLDCYHNMFYSCSNLNYVECLATQNLGNAWEWLYMVSPTGTFVKRQGASWSIGPSGIPVGWTVQDYNPYMYMYFTTRSLADNNTISFIIPSDVTSSKATSMSYSTDNGSTWATTNVDSTDQTITVSGLNSGDTVLWKGIADGWGDYRLYLRSACFSGNTYEAEGNIMSLLYGDEFSGQTTLNRASVFCELFSKSGLVNAGNLVLPATALADSCYQYMFSGCTSLTTAPALPATTLVYNCYSYMFSGCTSLTAAPELPATTLDDNCYGYMFRGCTSLTTAPELPATTLAYSCYWRMFYGCTSLRRAPELLAETLTDGCYGEMFYGCTNLNYIECLATDISATDCTYNWVDGVSSTGTFVKNALMSSWTTGSDGIPNNWTVIDE